MRISDRPVASKIAFQVFVTKADSRSKHELHPDNVAHSARLEFTLHASTNNRSRCVQNFTFTKHFPTKQRDSSQEDEEMEYVDPCYIDIEFETSGGVSHGLLDTSVANFDEQTRRLFAYLSSLTRKSSDRLRPVKFRVDVDAEHVNKTEGFLQALQELTNSLPQSPAYNPYRSHSGDVRIIYGQQKPRLLVYQGWGSEMVKFRAQSFFYDMDEYLVKMAYSAEIEWRRPYEQIKRIQEIPSNITLHQIGTTIVAIVRLDKSFLKDDTLPTEMQGSDVVLPEFTDAQLTIRVPRRSGPLTELKATGFTIPKYLEDESSEDIQMVLYGQRLGMLFREDADAPIRHPGFVKFDINEAPIKRQINALAKLKSNENGVGRWLPLLLNQEPRALPVIDILDGVDHDIVNNALRILLGLKTWNFQQKSAFKSLRMTKAGCSILEGFPGCGKTTVLAATAIFLHQCGFNILLVGSSNAAVDALTQEFIGLGTTTSYVRVRRGEVEKRSRMTANPREPGDIDEPAPDAQKQVALIGLLQSLKSSLSRKVEGDPEYSVLAQVQRRCKQATENNEKYMVNVAKGAQKTNIRSPDDEVDESERDIRNAWQVVKDYLSKPKIPRPPKSSTEENDKWCAEENAFQKCYEAVSEIVIQEASVVACTNNLAGTRLVAKNFGGNGKKIVIIADEDGQSLEPDAIIPLTSLDNASNVVGTIRGGDRHQLPPLVITATETPAYSEFGPQINRSLFDRLRLAKFPATIVSQQHRMNPRLSKFPSEFTYSGKMTNDPSVESINISPNLSNALLQWLKGKAPGASFPKGLELIGLNVTDGQARVNERTFSRSNEANVSVVMESLKHLMSLNALDGLMCAVITTYADQKRCYVDEMLKLSEKDSINWEETVRIATVDSMQGHQADVVILDWVVDSGTRSDLGFASDNRRANVALTRSRTCLIVVANGEIINNDRLRQTKSQEVFPEILVHWQHLMDQDLVVDCASGVLQNNEHTNDKNDGANNEGTSWEPCDGAEDAGAVWNYNDFQDATSRVTNNYKEHEHIEDDASQGGYNNRDNEVITSAGIQRSCVSGPTDCQW